MVIDLFKKVSEEIFIGTQCFQCVKRCYTKSNGWRCIALTNFYWENVHGRRNWKTGKYMSKGDKTCFAFCDNPEVWKKALKEMMEYLKDMDGMEARSLRTFLKVEIGRINEEELAKGGDLIIPIPQGGGEKNKGNRAKKPRTRWNDPTKKWEG